MLLDQRTDQLQLAMSASKIDIQEKDKFEQILK